MVVDPEPIRTVLEQSTVAKAAELDPRRFFDNTLIKEVNRCGSIPRSSLR